MKLSEITTGNKTEDFRFSLDIFNDDQRWQAVSDRFDYIGDIVGGRIWQFRGALSQFEAKLSDLRLRQDGGYRSNPRWNDGDWIYVSLKDNAV